MDAGYGETAVTGFCRLWSGWAPVFLLCNIIPWIWPGWASGAATILSWELGGGEGMRVFYSIASLIAIGLALSLGPVVIQYRRARSNGSHRLCPAIPTGRFWPRGRDRARSGNGPRYCQRRACSRRDGTDALFRCAGLCRCGRCMMNWCRAITCATRGYAMGAYVSRLTSPLTGKEEVVDDIGYHFKPNDENMRRWRGWWKAANREHFVTFYLLSVFSLMLLSLIAYATARQTPGLEKGLGFIRVESGFIGAEHGAFWGHAFRWMGIGILLTTALGLLDACARISADIIKTNWLRTHVSWSKSRLYFLMLWGQIAFGCAIMLTPYNQPIALLVLSASLNGGVMLIYLFSCCGPIIAF